MFDIETIFKKRRNKIFIGVDCTTEIIMTYLSRQCNFPFGSLVVPQACQQSFTPKLLTLKLY